jgi:hypothetical protein
MSTSILAASMLNVDRFLAIYFGIKYYIRVTQKKMKVLIFVMWTFCFLITYIFFYNENEEHGISCSYMYMKNKPLHVLNVIAYCCGVVIIFSNVLFYVFIVATMKAKDQWKSVAKISFITGTVLALNISSVFVLFPAWKTDIAYIYIFAGMPLLLKSIVDPFLFVWRFQDARFQCRLAFFFWSRKRRDAIQNERKEFFSSYNISFNQ